MLNLLLLINRRLVRNRFLLKVSAKKNCGSNDRHHCYEQQEIWSPLRLPTLQGFYFHALFLQSLYSNCRHMPGDACHDVFAWFEHQCRAPMLPEHKATAVM